MIYIIKGKHFRELVLCLMIVAVASGSVISGDNSDRRLNVAISGSPQSRNPLEIDDAVSTSLLLNNVFETLVKYGEERRTVEPALAVDWKVSDEGRVWILTLRNDVHFHDGSLMTSDKVVKHFRSNANFNGRVESDGDLQVRIIFDEKRLEFMKTITGLDYAITSHLDDGAIVGTGPFVISSWETPRRVVLEAYSGYWGKKSQMDEVVFHLNMSSQETLEGLRAGDIDVMDIVPPQMVEIIGMNDELKISALTGASITFVHLNIENYPLNRIEFRRALNQLINKENIIRDVLYGQAMECRGILPPAIGGKESGPPRVSYKPEEAKKVIREYLADSSRVFKMVGLPFARPYCPEPNKMARIIAGYLKGAGIHTRYISVDTMDEYLEKIRGDDYDFVISGWVLDSRNPDDFYSYLFALGDNPPIFKIHWQNPRFEKLIFSARGVLSLRKRWGYYYRAEDIFFQEMPWIMLAHPSKLSAYRSGISGLKMGPTGELRLGGVMKKKSGLTSYNRETD